MWIAIILVIVVFIIGKFLFDKNKQASKITMEGGMRNKYHELIEFLKAGDSRSKIFQKTSDSIGGYITVLLVPKINLYWIATDTEFKCPSVQTP